jgi:hypothetical protein
MHIGNTFENDIKELDPRKAWKYLGTKVGYDIRNQNEKAKLRKEYLKRLRLALSSELSVKIKFKQFDHLR